MCLATESKTPSINNGYDIVCYKILVHVGGKLITPYMDFLFPVGEIITDKAPDTSFDAFGFRVIESGYFHSYKTLEAAKKKVQELKRKDKKKKEFRIYRAEIPTETPFFEGQFEDLCSKSLKIIEECLD